MRKIRAYVSCTPTQKQTEIGIAKDPVFLPPSLSPTVKQARFDISDR